MDHSIAAHERHRQGSRRSAGRGLVLSSVLLAVALPALLLVDESAGVANPKTLLPALVAFAALTALLWLQRERVSRWLPTLSPAGLGLFRIAWAAGLIHALSLLGENLPATAVPAEFHRTRTALDLGLVHRLAEHPAAIDAIQSLTLIALCLFALGAFARIAYAAAALGFGILVHVLVTVHGGSHNWGLPLVTLLLLVVIPWQRGFGVDETIRRLRGREPRTGPALGLAIWLPGLTLGLAWTACAFAKLDRSGVEWVTGGAVKYHFVEDAANAPVDWGSWIATHSNVAVAFAAAGFLFEAGFLANVFFRGPIVRLLFGLSAAGFFVGTVLFQGVYWFPWWMLLLAFLPWQPLAEGLRARLPEVVVLIDGSCPLCRRSARVLFALDWLDRLEFVDANDADALAAHAPGVAPKEALERMAVSSAGRGVRFGYDGYLTIARSVPVLWPFALLGPLPGISHAGRAVYDRVAARRRRDHCSDETCAPGSQRELPRRRLDPARAAIVGLATCVLVSALVVEQVVASDRALEREPLVSNYPMYAWTFASTDAFDASRERKLSRYRIETPAGTDISNRLAATGDEEFVLDAAYALRRGARLSPDLASRIGSLRDAYLQSYGTALDTVVIRIDRRRFDWERGRFTWAARDATLARVDLTTLSLVPV